MNKAWFPITIVLAVLINLYIWIRLVVSRLYFKFDLAGIGLAQLTGAKVNVVVTSSVQNDNPFSITYSNLFVQLYYKSELIATSLKEDTNKYTIPASGVKVTQEQVQLFVNPTTAKLAVMFVSKQPVTIDYVVRVKVFGITLPSIKDNFTI